MIMQSSAPPRYWLRLCTTFCCSSKPNAIKTRYHALRLGDNKLNYARAWTYEPTALSHQHQHNTSYLRNTDFTRWNTPKSCTTTNAKDITSEQATTENCHLELHACQRVQNHMSDELHVINAFRTTGLKSSMLPTTSTTRLAHSSFALARGG